MIFQFVLTTLLAGVVLADIPSYMKICGRKNPNLDDCVKKSVEDLRGRLAKGIPELGAPSVEPLHLKTLDISRASSFNATAHNVDLYGFTKFKIENLHVDLENRKIQIDVNFDSINLEGSYDFSTKIVVPIVGKGFLKSTATDIAAKVMLKFDLVVRKGVPYMYFSSMTMKLNIKDYTSDFTPQNGSDGALTEGINAALSESRQEIIETITPNLEKEISKLILEYANAICTHFSYDTVLPNHE